MGPDIELQGTRDPEQVLLRRQRAVMGMRNPRVRGNGAYYSILAMSHFAQ